jgi:protein SCO1/2
VIADVVDLLDKRGVTVAPIFVTVDPQRDTPARLKEYLAAFHPRFEGLTGPVAKVMQVTTAYGASGEGDQVNAKPNGSYDVLHVAVAYLMGRNGEFLDIIRLKDAPAAIATGIVEAVDKAGRPHR